MDAAPAIVALELYTPRTAVRLETLEQMAGEPAGRFSVGLRQREMAVASACEDAVSMALTAVSQLLELNGVDVHDVGRLDVGSESSPDASKSIKSTLAGMLGMRYAEGTDHVNACYGATDALFAAHDWLSSLPEASKGKVYSIVVATDIAEYDTESAIPSGGGGCVALLLKNSTGGLRIKGGVRATVTEDVYDFCKPLGSLYPSVQGKYSIDCYVAAFEEVFKHYTSLLGNICGGCTVVLDSLAGVAFHSPFTKLALRSIALIKELPKRAHSECAEGNDAKEFPSSSVTYSELADIIDKDEELKAAVQRLSGSFSLNMFTGNCYTASWLVSLMSSLLYCGISEEKKDILVYSYGSGCIASMFILEARSIPAMHSNLQLTVAPSHAMDSATSTHRLLTQDEYAQIRNSRALCKENIVKRKNFHTKDLMGKLECSDLIEENVYYLAEFQATGQRVYKKHTP